MSKDQSRTDDSSDPSSPDVVETAIGALRALLGVGLAENSPSTKTTDSGSEDESAGEE